MKRTLKKTGGKPVPTEPQFRLSSPDHLGDPLALAVENVARRAEKYEEFRAQHGPVKVIMKNGIRLF